MSQYTAMFFFVVVMTCASWWTWLETWVGWVIFVPIASFIAYKTAKLALKKEHFGMWMINLGTSFYSSCIVYDIILFTSGLQSFGLLLTMTIVSIVIVSIFTKQNKAWMRPFSLSVMSGYLVMRGCSYWLFGWPNDLKMFFMIKNKQTISDQFDPAVMVLYFSIFGGMAIGSIFVRACILRRDEKRGV